MRLEELFEVIKAQGDKLFLGGKSVTSFSSVPEREVLVFSNKKGDTLNLRRKSNGKFRADINNRFDKEFKTLKDVAKFLNKEKYKFVGVDDI